jgi:hypothetical protein
MTDFDYKKYSLENLENWMHDAMSCDDMTPQDIYDTIHKVASENYYYHKHHASRAYELMELLNGSNHLVCDKDDKSPECQKAWNDFWGDVDEREYNIREAEYYNKRAELDAKPNKWILPVELDGLTGDCYIQLPDDLLEVANLKEGDQVEWIPQGNGSYVMKKVDVHT